MLRFLLLEDSALDAELIEASLLAEPISCELVRVETRAEFIAAIASNRFDLILADYALPTFDGLSALEIAQQHCPDLPFILVSASLGEERAIEALKSGATDYVLKQRLGRLVPAVQRALREADERRKLKQAEENLRQSEERYRAFITQSSEAIWRCELEVPIAIDRPVAEQVQHLHQTCYLAECNLAMARMYGFGCTEAIVGVKLADLLVHTDPRNFEYLQAFVESGYRLQDAESQERDIRGNQKWVVNNLVGIVEAGHLVRIWGNQRDVTERKQSEAARLRLAEEREDLLAREQAARAEAVREATRSAEANRIKDEFLAVLSHELRTPLNPILGWAKLLRTQKLNDEMLKRGLETIERNAKLQTNLIEDLLDISRILRGKLSLNFCPVDLTQPITDAIETMQMAAEAKSLQIETLLEPGVGVVWGDASRLQQVVWNLLSNAIKFTPEGGRIEIRLATVGSEAEIQVTDTGKGMSAEFLPQAFDYFRQADSSTTRVFGGLGLGLAIVRHLVELHGGTITAQSAGEGLGSTFTVRLPFIHLPLSAIAPPNATDTSPLLDGVRVLVVDDDADACHFLSVVLSQVGATVTIATSAAEALSALNQAQPDLLVSDIAMPGTDGYGLMRQIRAADPRTDRPLTAIAVTAYASASDREQALAAGFQAHLTKPIDPDTFIRVVAAFVGR
jgi:signal transduction histidine kinase/DNA-binding response OmpR family regulator